ncbi:lysine-specific histone demethylase 1B-like [Mya arenaria]|uniref:lysine-specific histone demethylase 1B-like n=1 Tax=Mya arenaria TaxID=6604 RepID=UPI0022E3DB9C|nr:lysine-specific histone demethylase 1B-like [Mya arenaria]
MSSRKPSRQSTKRKAASDAADSDSAKVEKKVRSCPKNTCPAKAPICFARVSSTCCGNGYTSRWYHITAGEHFCNECFEHFYRSHNVGYDIYANWKRLWSQYGNSDNGIKAYMCDQILPYWVQCNLCGKWRSVFRETEITTKFLKSYVCTKVLKHMSQEESCDTPEDFRVEMAKEIYFWPMHISCNQYLRNAVYAPYLRDFTQDSVGISPSDTSVHKFEEGIFEVRPYLQPFQYDSDSPALTFPPDHLSDEEQLYFPEFTGIYLRYYLMIRNTAVTLWCLDVKTYVTLELVMLHLNLRGLSRVWLTLHVERLLLYLTLKGHINVGILTPPKSASFIQDLEQEQKHPVVIVGGGIAGLTAARQLVNLGVQVQVIEAGPQLGGRAVDGEGSEFPSQAHMVIGCYNNPLVVMCKQTDIPVAELSESCVLLTESGEIIDDKIDKRMQFHFEAMLDINKQLCKDQEKDKSLLDQFRQLHSQFKDESGIRFSKLEEQLLEFHMSNLEFACGSRLSEVSALHWDQNDDLPQFSGPPITINGNFEKILASLAEGIDIVKNCPVTSIDYTGDVITVTGGSQQFQASKVVVCVPLSVLKDGEIKFTPALPEDKTISLGCGHVEKVMLKFDRAFWEGKVRGGAMFGCVSTTTGERTMFDVFYDISQKSQAMLCTYISGERVEKIRGQTDQQVVDACVQCLKNMFKDVPAPTQFFISRWYERPNVGMSFSYIPVGAGADAFANMEREVSEKLFFAGEATSGQFPQTLTGAYMSGLREAEKIYRSLGDIT